MKIQAPASFMVVASIALLAGGLTMVELPCPVCDGKGFLESALGLLKVESVESEFISVQRVRVQAGGCDLPAIASYYTYAVNILLTNEGTELIKGAIAIVFSPNFSEEDYRRTYEGGSFPWQVDLPGGDYEEVVVSIYVSVPAGTTKNIKHTLSFRDEIMGDVVRDRFYEATVAESYKNIVCPVSGASGRLPFPEWLRQKIILQ